MSRKTFKSEEILQNILNFLQSSQFQELFQSGIMRAPPGTQIEELQATFNPNQTLKTWTALDANGNVLFTLNFLWNSDGTFQDCKRTEG